MNVEDKRLDGIAERFFEIKVLQKELDQELSELRQQILEGCKEQDSNRLELENYEIKLIVQQRREYDENRLYETLPDLELWRMLSKPDNSKISSLIKLKIISEEKIKDTYAVKNVTVVQVDKK
ncbi:hypothetical protein J41TS12_13270 [Paenibacillus antibioticophila]|uniref:Uncharacterized protein n=1 Tax=Paenibacillus antibioticophila TaxID=1274374 RepID=A0A919XQB7_9BACL|nr:hypothetical protein [Paenibacillus antibioticophila]GIO36466.1 hypothetical protein J41TS12_13270 [Paenibacillus antibioticophila]